MCLDGNRGDLAILDGTISSLRRVLGQDIEVTVAPVEVMEADLLRERQADSAALSDRPLLPSPVPNRRDGSLTTLGWSSRHARALLSRRAPFAGAVVDRSFRAAIESADLLLVKGGSWLFSYPTVAQTLFTQRMLHPMNVAHSVGTPAVVLGTSLGPWSKWTAPSYRRALHQCSSVVVRERLSADFAHAQGLSNVIVGKDMAYGLYSPPSGPIDKRGFAVTPRVLPYVEEAGLKRYERAIVDAVHTLLDIDDGPCYLATQVDEDAELCHRLADAIGRPDRVVVADELSTMGLVDLVKWYGQRQLLLGSRIHSVILAAMAHTPSVIMECDPPKMVGISEDLGLADWRIDAASEAIDSLSTRALEAWKLKDETAEALATTMPRLRDDIDLYTRQALKTTGLLT